MLQSCGWIAWLAQSRPESFDALKSRAALATRRRFDAKGRADRSECDHRDDNQDDEKS
jgi:hypothetical protein